MKTTFLALLVTLITLNTQARTLDCFDPVSAQKEVTLIFDNEANRDALNVERISFLRYDGVYNPTDRVAYMRNNNNEFKVTQENETIKFDRLKLRESRFGTILTMSRDIDISKAGFSDFKTLICE